MTAEAKFQPALARGVNREDCRLSYDAHLQVSPAEPAAHMLKVDEWWIRQVEEQYPGFRATLEHHESLLMPRCPTCSSDATAKVMCGVVGRTMHLAAATTKVKLVANGRPTDYFCTSCESLFPGEPTASGK